MIPVGGLAIQPEASSGCVCEYSLQCTVALQPRSSSEAWGIFASRAPSTPVKHLALNLGAPGDRRDEQGKLWVAYPRPKENWASSKSRLGGRMSLRVAAKFETIEGGGFYNQPANGLKVATVEPTWVAASGCRGVRSARITLVDEGQPDGQYTVRLVLARADAVEARSKPVTIKIQGQVVKRGFAIGQSTDGSNGAVTQEFSGVKVQDDLTIEFTPEFGGAQPTASLVLHSIEAIQE